MLKRLNLSSFADHFSEVLSNFQSMTPLRILLILEKPNLVTIKFAWPPPPQRLCDIPTINLPPPPLQLTVNFLRSVRPSFKLRWRWLIPPPVPEKPCDLPKLFHSLPPGDKHWLVPGFDDKIRRGLNNSYLDRARPWASSSTVGTQSLTNLVKRDCSMLENFWKAMFFITGGSWEFKKIYIYTYT